MATATLPDPNIDENSIILCRICEQPLHVQRQDWNYVSRTGRKHALPSTFSVTCRTPKCRMWGKTRPAPTYATEDLTPYLKD